MTTTQQLRARGLAHLGLWSAYPGRTHPGRLRWVPAVVGLALVLGAHTFGQLLLVQGATLFVLVYAALSFGRRPEEEKELKITIPENLDYTGLFDDLFGEYTRSAELISVRTTGMGSLYNLHYHVRLVSPEIEKQFLDAIRCRNGNLDIVCGKVPQVKEAL